MNARCPQPRRGQDAAVDEQWALLALLSLLMKEQRTPTHRHQPSDADHNAMASGLACPACPASRTHRGAKRGTP